LVQQAGCGDGSTWSVVLLIRAGIHRPVFERTIGAKSWRSGVERADALLQKLPRHLKNRLRKAVVEAQLVGAGGVVNNNLACGYDTSRPS